MLYAIERPPSKLDEPASKPPRLPQFGVAWEPRVHSFTGSLKSFFARVKPVKMSPAVFFRDYYVRPYRPRLSFLASVLWHMVVIFLIVTPLWHFPPSRTLLAPVRIETTWYPPARDLPPITFPGEPAAPSPAGEAGKPLPASGADAYHPRQTILSQQQNPTHPRQTLIQPDSSPEPPKIAPRMPNIVEWGNNSHGARAPLRLTPSTLAPRLPQRSGSDASASAPQMPNLGKDPGALTLAQNSGAEPKMPVGVNSPPRASAQSKRPDVAAPKIAASKSAAPAEPLTVAGNTNQPKIPQGPASAPRAAEQFRPEDVMAPRIGNTTNNASSAEPLSVAPNAKQSSEVKMPVPQVSAPVSNRPRPDKPAPAPEIRNNAPTYGKMVSTGNQPPDVKLPTGTASVPKANTARNPDNGAAPNIKHNVPASANAAGNANQPPDVKMPTSSTAAPKANSARNSDAGAPPEIKNNGSGNGAVAGNTNRPRDVKMPSASASAPKPNSARHSDAGAPPDLGTTVTGNESDTRRLIALSANPAPVSPEIKVPAGNLSAHVSISPEGTRPGVPGGAPATDPTANGSAAARPGEKPAVAGGSNGASGAKPGSGGGAKTSTNPTGVSISGGNPNLASRISGPPASGPEPRMPGPGDAAATPPPGTPPAGTMPSGTPSAGTPPDASAPAATPPEPEPINPSKTQPSTGMDSIDASSSPEEILGSKRVYTLYINMPNLTSATGSWVLNFSELRTENVPDQPGSGDVTGPQPVRKVDPRYPPSLMNAHVEGEVVLYAIIRRDGSVDSIQLMKGIDGQLDQNAMEALARWKFRPATRNGTPVELEAVIHIPFRAAPPL
jgi:TonB family protein